VTKVLSPLTIKYGVSPSGMIFAHCEETKFTAFGPSKPEAKMILDRMHASIVKQFQASLNPDDLSTWLANHGLALVDSKERREQ